MTSVLLGLSRRRLPSSQSLTSVIHLKGRSQPTAGVGFLETSSQPPPPQAYPPRGSEGPDPQNDEDSVYNLARHMTSQ